MKRTLFFTLLYILISFQLKAQLIGNSNNGNSQNKTVEAQNIDGGEYSGDVNTYNGIYTPTYNLGSVSTGTGLGFSLTMSYSSSITSGENVPHIGGIPYGEGWDLNIPTITVSTEDYNKYSLEDLQRLRNITTNSPDSTPVFNFKEEVMEGRLYYYAPILNIPNYASGRLVYTGRKDKVIQDGYVFVLHKFEKYVEAIFYGDRWEVYLDDGTMFTFRHVELNARQPSNQRATTSNTYEDDENLPDFARKNLYLPKIEASKWMCSTISHRNKIGRVEFVYKGIGDLNYFKNLDQIDLQEALYNQWINGGSSLPTNINDRFLNKGFYDRLLLTDITAGRERLELSYDYLDDNLVSNSGSEILKLSDSGVTQVDALYAKKLVRSWDKGSGQDEFWDIRRYKHVKDTMNGINNYNLFTTKSNPYLGTFYGQPSSCSGLGGYFVEQSIDNDSIDGIPFNYGFLEFYTGTDSSSFSKIVSGDIYEIKTNLYTHGMNQEHYGCLFDINIVTGDLSKSETISNNKLSKDDYDVRRQSEIFSTFRSPLKWSNYKDGGCELSEYAEFSNYFNFSAKPNEYNGFFVQIGPANSDNDFSEDPINIGIEVGGVQSPFVCGNYANIVHGIDSFGNPYNLNPNDFLKLGDPIPMNFGIGIPWKNVKDLYADSDFEPWKDYCGDGSNSNSGWNTFDNYWWNHTEKDEDQDNYMWDNIPSLANDSIFVQDVQLYRYGKLPLVLKKVSKLVKNSNFSDPPNEPDSNWYFVATKGFEYSIETAPRYVASLPDSVYITDYGEYTFEDSNNDRNAFLLKRIITLPNETDSLSFSAANGFYTQFGYSEMEMVDNTAEEYIGIIGFSTNYFLLDSINTETGKQIGLDFYSPLDSVSSSTALYVSRPRPYENNPSNCNLDWSRRIKPNQFTLQLDFRTKTLSLATNDGTSVTTYEYSQEKKYYEENLQLPQNFQWDYRGKPDLGFGNTVVTQTGSGETVKTEYEYYTEHLLKGKLKQVSVFDDEDDLVTKQVFDYDITAAFEPAQYRYNDEYTKFDYHDYKSDNLIDDPQYTRPTFNFEGPFSSSMLTSYIDSMTWWRTSEIEYDTSGYIDWLDSIPQAPTLSTQTCNNPNSQDSTCNCIDTYDQLSDEDKILCDEWTQEYFSYLSEADSFGTEFLLEHPDMDFQVKESDFPYFLETRYFDYVQNYRYPGYLFSFFIKKIKESNSQYLGDTSITYFTEYDYYDANFNGTSDCPGYDIFVNDNCNEGLYWTPSWQTYSVKKYNSASPDTNLVEYFYLYDLINNTKYHVDTSCSWAYKSIDEDFDLLYQNFYYERDRSRVLQTRTTNSNASNAHTISNYFKYKMGWETANTNEFLGYLIDPETIDCADTSSTFVPPCLSAWNNEIPSGYCPYDISGPEKFWIWCDCSLDFPAPLPQNDQRYLTNPLFNYIALEEEIIQTSADSSDSDIIYFDNQYDPQIDVNNLVTRKILEVNQSGTVVKEQNQNGLVTYYEYHPSRYYMVPYCHEEMLLHYYVYEVLHQNLPKSITVGYGLDNARTTKYEYYLDNRLKSVIDTNGIKNEFIYDEFGRKIQQKLNDTIIQNIQYSICGGDNSGDFNSRALSNYIQTTTFVDQNQSFVTTDYVDPLGRAFGSTLDSVVTSNKIFDTFGRIRLDLKPFQGTPLTYTSYYNSYSAEHNEIEYYPAPRAEIKKASGLIESILGTEIKQSTVSYKTKSDVESLLTNISTSSTLYDPYLIGTIFKVEKTADEDGKYQTIVSNSNGKQVCVISNNGLIGTFFKYDELGNLINTLNGVSQENTYYYNYLGLLSRKNTVDEGTQYFAYDHSANVIGKKYESERILYYTYDIFSRPVDEIRILEDYSDLFQNNGLQWVLDDSLSYLPDLEELDHRFSKQFFYDYYDQNIDISELPILAQSYVQNGILNAFGKPIMTISYDRKGAKNERKYYSYNDDGSVRWELVDFEFGGNALLYRIDYPYHLYIGSPKVVNVDLNCDNFLDFQYLNKYDNKGRLEKVYGDFQNGFTPSTNTYDGNLLIDLDYDQTYGHVSKKTYYADLHDPGLGSQECPDHLEVDTINYRYDGKLRLEEISGKWYKEELFYDSEEVGSLSGDNCYNGNINGIKSSYFFTNLENSSSNFGTNGFTEYAYTYDNINRLTQANANVDGVSSLNTTGGNLGDASFAYDDIGNFDTLIRKENENNAVVSNQYDFTYGTGNNLLSSLTLNSSSYYHYSFDGDGNLATDYKNKIGNVLYYRHNLPTSLTAGGLKAFNVYNTSDQRIFKTGSHFTAPPRPVLMKEMVFYIRDYMGKEIGVYDLQKDELTWYLFDRERSVKVEHEPNLRSGNPENQSAQSNSGHASEEFWASMNNTGDSIPQSHRYDKTLMTVFHRNDTSYTISQNQVDSLYNAGNWTVYDSTLQEQILALGKVLYIIDSSGFPYYKLASAAYKDSIPSGDSLISSTILYHNRQLVEIPDTTSGNSIFIPIGAAIGMGTDRPRDPTYTTPSSNDPFRIILDEIEDEQMLNTSYYNNDHLGNARFVFYPRCHSPYINYYAEYAGDYFPFGKILREWIPYQEAERYLTTQHERDKETNWDYRGARFYDSDVSRFMSVDPLADQFPGWNPYHYVHNNPLRFTDPTGMKADSTPIYNLSGAYQFTIPDNLPNESHFLSNSAIVDLAGQCCSDANQEGEYARSVSNYFIGGNTTSQIKSIMNLSSSENKERGFVFYLAGKGKELSVLDITSSDISRGENWFSMGDALDKNVPSSISPLGTGHTHPYNPFASGPEPGNSWVDFAPNLVNRSTGKLGGNPFLIAHKTGIKVYSSAQRLDRPNYSLPSYYHFKYVGSKGNRPSIRY